MERDVAASPSKTHGTRPRFVIYLFFFLVLFSFFFLLRFAVVFSGASTYIAKAFGIITFQFGSEKIKSRCPVNNHGATDHFDIIFIQLVAQKTPV